ncbi:hypothetical protein OZX65_01590 [Leuconostocaceae bacterium ESL0723]|nr:hypothetical protein OZX65_01590 [Leuconostocaceae bacterium ESL0723]
MFKYLFTNVPTSMGDGEYRKILIRRQLLRMPYLLVVLLFGFLLKDNPHLNSAIQDFGKGLPSLSLLLLLMFIIRIFRISKNSLTNIHIKKIEEVDERRQYNDLRALRLSFFFVITLLYITFFVLMFLNQSTAATIIAGIALLGMVFHWISQPLLNKFS